MLTRNNNPEGNYKLSFKSCWVYSFAERLFSVCVQAAARHTWQAKETSLLTLESS